MMESERLTAENADYEAFIERVAGMSYLEYVQKCINKEKVEMPCVILKYMLKMHERLAELEDKIENGTLKEEKTCKNVSEMHPVDGFTCSECGISLVDYVRQITDEDYETTYHEYEIKYCPNCGAKVVEE
jgi:hypothetical protein